MQTENRREPLSQYQESVVRELIEERALELLIQNGTSGMVATMLARAEAARAVVLIRKRLEQP